MGANRELTLRPGESVTWPLKGRGSAGYSWTWEGSGADRIVQVTIGGVGEPPQPPGRRPPGSYSADEQATITAIGAGEVTIRFMLRRAWEHGNPPIDEEAITVRVRS